MNLIPNIYTKISITHYREKQIERIIFFVNVMIKHLQSNNVPIDYSTIVIKYDESKLSKAYQYSGIYHSTMELTVTYKAIIDPLTGASIPLDRESVLINTYIPKLIDGTKFILNGSTYIPMTYLTDHPISFKKNSVSFESLFMSIIMDNKNNRIIVMDSFIPMVSFLRLFFSDSELISLDPEFQPDLNMMTRSASKEQVSTILKMDDVTQIDTTLNKMFFDEWTAELYTEIYGIGFCNIKSILTHAIKNKYTESPGFTDLKYKRMTFVEQLLSPMFKGVSHIIKSLYTGTRSSSMFRITNNTSMITSYFAKEMNNSTLYESTNTYESLTISKTSYKTPGISLRLPMSVSGIHETYKGTVCPISVSNSNSGETLTLTPLTVIDPIYGLIDIECTRAQDNNPIISSALCSVPFISSTDATRLQMACKQLSQSLTHDNCERPYVLGKDHNLLCMENGIARYNGVVVHSDDRFMVILYDGKNNFDIFNTPIYKHTKDKIVSSRRFILGEGDEFVKGDMLYEYDSTKDGIVSYGYNLNVAFMPLFGFTCEDAIVISESTARKCRHRKSETLLIPIFPFMTIHKLNSYSTYQIIPEIGEICDNTEIFKISILNSNESAKQLKAIVEPLKRDQYVLRKTVASIDIIICTKLKDIKLSDVRVHTNVDSWVMDDVSSRKLLDKLLIDKLGELMNTASSLKRLFGAYAADLLYRHHIWKNAKPAAVTIDPKLRLQGVIELTVVSERNADIGDKFANRYANKGVISTIIPDDLMPRTSNGEAIDYICNPLSVFNRMNYGQLTEGIIGKIMRKCETSCLEDHSQCSTVLRKLAGLSRIMDSETYACKLETLANRLDKGELFDSFISSLKDGMYFEAKSFVSLDMQLLIEYAKEHFDLNITEDVVLPVGLYDYMKYQYGVDYKVEEDITIKDIFITPSYILKLKHLAADKLTARDFGKYSAGTNAPSKAAGHDKASKIGGMEFDGLIGSSAIRTIREFRSVKAGSIDMKPGLIEQILDSGSYNIPDQIDTDSILQTVENLITAVSSKSK